MPEASASSIAQNFASVRGIQLAYLDVGKGPAVLFLHGFPFDKSMWVGQIELLSSAGFRAIAPDLRGLGETKAAAEISTMEEMARDAASLLDTLNIEQADVCGLSMGGYVPFEFADLFPSRIGGLILAGTRASADSEPEKAAREQQVQTMLRAGMVPISI